MDFYNDFPGVLAYMTMTVEFLIRVGLFVFIVFILRLVHELIQYTKRKQEKKL